MHVHTVSVPQSTTSSHRVLNEVNGESPESERRPSGVHSSGRQCPAGGGRRELIPLHSAFTQIRINEMDERRLQQACVVVARVPHLPIEKGLLVVKVRFVVSRLRKRAKDLRATCEAGSIVGVSCALSHNAQARRKKRRRRATVAPWPPPLMRRATSSSHLR